MENITEKIGDKIRHYRKLRNMTLQDMAEEIHKSKSVLSKYEKGQISVDIMTLYDIAKVLHIQVEELLYKEPLPEDAHSVEDVPTFFKGINRFYVYYFDGRNLTVNESVVDVFDRDESGDHKIRMYMNILNYDHYQNSENTYIGYLKHYDSISSLALQNRDTPMEKLFINILAPFVDTSEKWGLFYGISARPLMPVALKVLITKKPLEESKELIQKLKISKEDYRLMHLYNMFTVH